MATQSPNLPDPNDLDALEEAIPNRISASVDDETIGDIQAGLSSIRERLPFLLNFLEDNRPYLLEINEHLLPFMERSLEDAHQHPNLVPPFLDLEELARDLQLYRQLLRLLEPIQEMTSMLHDTAMAAGSDAFETALVFYKRVRMGAQLGDKEAEKVLEEYNEMLAQVRSTGTPRVKVS